MTDKHEMLLAPRRFPAEPGSDAPIGAVMWIGDYGAYYKRVKDEWWRLDEVTRTASDKAKIAFIEMFPKSKY